MKREIEDLKERLLMGQEEYKNKSVECQKLRRELKKLQKKGASITLSSYTKSLKLLVIARNDWLHRLTVTYICFIEELLIELLSIKEERCLSSARNCAGNWKNCRKRVCL